MLVNYNLQLKLPDNFTWSEDEMSIWVLLKLYESGKMSAGKVCEILQVNRQGFLSLLDKYDISWGEINLTNIQNDWKNAQRYSC